MRGIAPILLSIILAFAMVGCSESTYETDATHEKTTEKAPINYCDESRANHFINCYNELHPETPLDEDNVECEDTAQGIASDVTWDSFSVHFGCSDGDDNYKLVSSMECSDENKKAFLTTGKEVLTIWFSDKITDEELNQTIEKFEKCDDYESIEIEMKYDTMMISFSVDEDNDAHYEIYAYPKFW